MSSIPPNMNIAGTFSQTQVSAETTSKTQDAERNKRARDARELAKLADQQQHEVENTEEAENLRTHRVGEDDGRQPKDSFETEQEEEKKPLYHTQTDQDSSDDNDALPDEHDPQSHIDLTA